MHRKNPLIYVFSASFAALALVALSYGCSASNEPAGGEGGQNTAKGGTSTEQGGATIGQGGAQTGQGGSTAQGGAPTQGGAANGGSGSAQGGSTSTGAASSGGATAQGGASVAGSGNGGASSNGGANSGGISSNGGASSGGISSNGGASSAGASNGGASAMCPATNTDASCTSSTAKTGAACTVNCCIPCGLNSMGNRVCTCTGGSYASCSCGRPASYMGKNISNDDPNTAPPCANDGTVAMMKGTACTTEWEQCITSDAPSGTTYQGCACMMGNSGLQWYCGSTNKWFNPAP
jgi:hypothetical protein